MAFETFFYQSATPCWISDGVTGKFIAVNGACIRQFGYEEDVFLNKLHVRDLLPDKHALDGNVPSLSWCVDIYGAPFRMMVCCAEAKLNGRKCKMVTAFPVPVQPVPQQHQSVLATVAWRHPRKAI